MDMPIHTGLPHATAAAGSAATPRPNRPATSGTEMAPLMRLHERSKAQAAKLRAEAAQLATDTGDPAKQAVAQSRTHFASQLDELRRLAGPRPGSNARHALAAIVGRLEAGREPLSPGDELRMRLAVSADHGTLPPGGAGAVRGAVQGLDRVRARLEASSQDPTTITDPQRLVELRTRMDAVNAAMTALSAALSGGKMEPAVAAALGAAGRQSSDGHVVRDVLAALRARG